MKTISLALVVLLMASYARATLNQALEPHKDGHDEWNNHHKHHDDSSDCDDSSSSCSSSWVSISRTEVRHHYEKSSSDSCETNSWDGHHKKHHKEDGDGKDGWKDHKHWDDKSDSSECSDSDNSDSCSDDKHFVRKGFLKEKLNKVWDNIHQMEAQICDIQKKDAEQDERLNDLECRVETLEKAVFTGKTRPCDWECDTDPSTGIIAISVHVDLCHLGLTETPVVVTSLAGEKKIRDTVGATSIYDLTNKGFTVRVRFLDEEDGVTTELAEKWGWYINYAVYNQDNAPKPEPCPECPQSPCDGKPTGGN